MSNNDEIEAIARECAVAIRAYTPSPYNKIGNMHPSDMVIAAANRIAALKVKESGAVDEIELSANWCPSNRRAFALRSANALRAIISEGTP